MSPRCALFLLSLPPVRGAMSLLAVLLAITVVAQPGGDLAFRLGAGAGVLLIGPLFWALTLAGFLRDVGRPRRREGTVVVASRPRPLAVGLSWAGLGAFVIGALLMGVFLGDEGAALPAAADMLMLLGGLVVATVLPRLSRWSADRAGALSVSARGLHVLPGAGETAAVVPWSTLGPVGPGERVRESLPGRLVQELSPRVRWHPGARDAVARWAAQGFAPSVAETRALHLDPHWSPDPAAADPSPADRWRDIAIHAWGALLCIGLVGAGIALVVTGTAPWWALLLMGWAPVLGAVILLRRLVWMVQAEIAVRRGGVAAPAAGMPSCPGGEARR